MDEVISEVDMMRIVLHRLDGVAEITWAEDDAGTCGEIHRTWEAQGPTGTFSFHENYRRRDGGRFVHFIETCKTTVEATEEVTGEAPAS